MTAFLDLLDASIPDAARYALSAWFLVVAAYLLWCGNELRREQAAADRLASGAPPPRLTLVREPPPEPAEGKPARAGGIPHAERLHLERAR